jgi:hypothetical protein
MRADNRIVDVELPDTNDADRWLDRICESAAHDCQKQAIQEEDGMYVWDGEEENPIKWRPSIFMPRWASRITLEITNVRVQRLQEISESDAKAEGIIWRGGFEPYGFTHRADSDPRYGAIEHFDMAREAYRKLWDSINGPRSWDSNPWVYAVSFKIIAAERNPYRGENMKERPKSELQHNAATKTSAEELLALRRGTDAVYDLCGGWMLLGRDKAFQVFLAAYLGRETGLIVNVEA